MNSGKNIAAWILSVLTAIFFLAAGIPKVIGVEGVAQQFEDFGYGAGFATAIGLIEVIGAILLLIPALAFFGADLLICIMIGAIYTHLSTGIGSPIGAIGALVALVLIVWLRWPPFFMKKGA